MRRIVAASLFLSSMIFPAVANASSLMDDVSAPTQHLRVSTGVTAPALVDSVSITPPAGLPNILFPIDAQVGLSLMVDEKGHPQDVQIEKSLNPNWDARVVDAVRQFRFRPATLDKAAIPMEVHLTVNIER